MEKKIVICNWGSWGYMDRSNPVDEACYNEQTEIIQKYLEGKGFSVTVVKQKLQPGDFEPYMGVIFLTRGEIGFAQEVKAMFPHINVLLLSAMPPAQGSGGVKILDKDIDWKFLPKIVALLSEE